MATRDRRTFMALDDAYYLSREIEAGQEHPQLYRLCASIATVDAGLASVSTGQGHYPISARAWSQVRNTLYNYLVTHYGGYFVIYPENALSPLEPGSPWPDSGLVEFYPERGRRRDDSYTATLEDLDFKTLTALRWCYADGRQTIRPEDVPEDEALLATDGEEPGDGDEAALVLERLYDVCAEEATRGKKKAHAKWWQLYWEANSCPDRRAKQELHKQMTQLQSVWGRPS